MRHGAPGHALGDDGRDSALHAAIARYAGASRADTPEAKQTKEGALGLVTLLCRKQTKQRAVQRTSSSAESLYSTVYSKSASSSQLSQQDKRQPAVDTLDFRTFECQVRTCNHAFKL